MKAHHSQLIWEIVAYSVSGTLLIVAIVSPSFKHIVYLLVAEYIIDLAATINWLKWLTKINKNLHIDEQ